MVGWSDSDIKASLHFIRQLELSLATHIITSAAMGHARDIVCYLPGLFQQILALPQYKGVINVIKPPLLHHCVPDEPL